MTRKGATQGYVSGRPTAFRQKLEADPLGKKTLELQAEKVKRGPRKDAAARLPPPPEGYERPTTWLQVARAPRTLLACPEGWEPCEHGLRVEEDNRGKPVLKGPAGRIRWRGNVLEDVVLKSLRVPGAGERELRHG